MTTTTESTPVAVDGFRRDRFTWLAYLLLAYFAYHQTMIGSVMPFLIEDLALDYTAGALHTTVFAVGVILAGLTGARAADQFGRRAVFWGGGTGMAVGVTVLALGQQIAVTLIGMFIMGFIGTYLLVMIQATLADHHEEQRATALTEANVIGSLGFILPPLFVGLFASTAIGWRGALFMGGIAWLLAVLTAFRVPIPQVDSTAKKNVASEAQVDSPEARPPLSRAFWTYWSVIVMLAMAQWGVVAWGAGFMIDAVGLEPPLASALMNAFFVPMVIGRIIGSRLTRKMDSFILWPAALGVAFAGFLIFWLAPVPLLNVVGLFITGLGIANLFPLGLSVATTIAAPHSDRASARVSLATGIAILTAPQILGAVADQTDIKSAYGLMVALMVLAAGLMAAARWSQRLDS